jgi:hypothetical protein
MRRACAWQVFPNAPTRHPEAKAGSGSRAHFAVRANAAAASTRGHRVSAEVTVGILGRCDNGLLVRAPIRVAHGGHAGHDGCRAERVFGIGLAGQWLHLQQWEVGPQAYRLVRLGKAEIGEKRAEPAIRLDDALIETVAARGGEIGRRADQQLQSSAVRAISPVQICSAPGSGRAVRNGGAQPCNVAGATLSNVCEKSGN